MRRLVAWACLALLAGCSMGTVGRGAQLDKYHENERAAEKLAKQRGEASPQSGPAE